MIPTETMQYHYSNYHDQKILLPEEYMKAFYVRPDGAERGWEEYKADEAKRYPAILEILDVWRGMHFEVRDMIHVYSGKSPELMVILVLDDVPGENGDWLALEEWFEKEGREKMNNDAFGPCECPFEYELFGCDTKRIVINESF